MVSCWRYYLWHTGSHHGNLFSRDFLILPRNSHISAISALVLTGAVPKYIVPHSHNDWDIAAAVTPSQVLKAILELEKEGKNAAAVFITSPTYHGICSNLSMISEMCHSRKIPLIVDEAHGAHFGFHSELPKSALQQGADLTVQSTHKVLCSLSQSSMLHMSGFWKLGLSDSEADQILYKDHEVICELVGNKSITYVFNLGTRRDHVQRLLLGIKRLAATYASIQQPEKKVLNVYELFEDIIMSLIPRDAFFASKRKVAIRESIGEVSAELICSYPPGVPVLIPGEVITEKIVDYLLHVRSKGAEISGTSDPMLSSIVVCGKLSAGKKHI